MEQYINLSRATQQLRNRAYVSSGLGDVACLDAIGGQIIWSVPANDMFQGKYGRWGISESILLHDDKVFIPLEAI